MNGISIIIGRLTTIKKTIEKIDIKILNKEKKSEIKKTILEEVFEIQGILESCELYNNDEVNTIEKEDGRGKLKKRNKEEDGEEEVEIRNKKKEVEKGGKIINNETETEDCSEDGDSDLSSDWSSEEDYELEEWRVKNNNKVEKTLAKIDRKYKNKEKKYHNIMRKKMSSKEKKGKEGKEGVNKNTEEQEEEEETSVSSEMNFKIRHFNKNHEKRNNATEDVEEEEKEEITNINLDMKLNKILTKLSYNYKILQSLQSQHNNNQHTITNRQQPTYADITRTTNTTEQSRNVPTHPNHTHTTQETHIANIQYTNTIHITSNQNSELNTPTQIKAYITETIDPTKLNMNNCKITLTNRGALIHTTNTQDINTLQEYIQEYHKEHLQTTIPTKRKPQIIIKYIPKDTDNDDLIEIIKQQYKTITEETHITHTFNNKANTHKHAILTTTPNTYNEIINKKIRIGWKQCPTETYINIKQCTKCLAFGHTKHYCTNTTNTCHTCGSTDPKHDNTTCTLTLTCIHCKKTNTYIRNPDNILDTTHSSLNNRNCPKHIEIKNNIINNTQY